MLVDRLLAALGLVTILTIGYSSNAGMNFYIDNDHMTTGLRATYAVLLFTLVIRPQIIKLHLLLPIIGILYWSGRAAAFLEIIVNGENVTLWGAVLERIYIAALLLFWHYHSARKVAILSAKKKLSIPLPPTLPTGYA